jgi:hypothetical protein
MDSQVASVPTYDDEMYMKGKTKGGLSVIVRHAKCA